MHYKYHIYPQNFKDMQRLSKYPRKLQMLSEPSLDSGDWTQRRQTNKLIYGDRKGRIITEKEFHKKLKKYKEECLQNYLEFITETALYIVRDVMSITKIKDNYFMEQIRRITGYHENDFTYEEYMINEALGVLSEFIEKYKIETLDHIALRKLEELKKEIYMFYESEKQEDLPAKLLEYKFIFN